MNVRTQIVQARPSRDEAEAALALLRQWAGASSDSEVATLDASVALLVPGQSYPALSRAYPDAFLADDAYKATLPDLQNGPASLIRARAGRSSMSAFPISACRSGTIPATAATFCWKPA